MSLIQFDIRHPNGQREAIVVEGQRALIGSGSHCDVRLPMDQAAYEHVRIESIGGTLRAESVAEKPPATINGMPLTQSPLAADSVLGIGNVRIFVGHVSDLVEGAQLAAAKSKQSSPVMQIALVVGFGAAAYLLLAEPDNEIAPPPAEAPVLFADVAPTCPQANPVQAVALGQEQLDIANAKRERMPFFVKDGVTAVGLYQVAAACFKVGGVASQATEAAEAATSLRKSLSDDFRARQLRLTYSLQVGDYPLARQDVTVLRAMTDGKKGPYVEWLATAAKQLVARSSK
jgi:hypothetical protein